jgi:hypothetical protein
LLGLPLLRGAALVTAADRRAAGTTPRAHPAVAIGRQALRVAVITTLQRPPAAEVIMAMGLPVAAAGITTTGLRVAVAIIGLRVLRAAVIGLQAVLPAATITEPIPDLL